MVKEALHALNRENPLIDFEIRAERPDGEIRWMQWTNRAIYDESEALVEYLAVGRDITDRIRSEQQIRESRNTLRSVFDGISDPLVMVREDMTVVMLNRAALQFFDATLYRDLIGTPCLEFFRGRYGEEEINLVQAAITGQEPARYESGIEEGFPPLRGGVRLPGPIRPHRSQHGHHPGHRPDEAAADGTGADPERKARLAGASHLRDRPRDQQPEQLHQLQHADPPRLPPGDPAGPRRARRKDARF